VRFAILIGIVGGLAYVLLYVPLVIVTTAWKVLRWVVLAGAMLS
jgi:hypothetical protein